MPPPPSSLAAAPVAAPAAGGSRTHYLVILAISLCHLINDVMQSLLSAIYPLLQAEFALSFAQIGLMTFAFMGTASVLQPLIGMATDRRPVPQSLALGMGSTLIGLLFLAMGTSYAWLLAGAAMIGIGSAVFHPEASRVARAASGGKYGTAQSLFQVGGNTGHALGPLLAAFIVVPLGRAAVGAFAALALVGMTILAAVGRWHEGHRRAAAARSDLILGPIFADDVRAAKPVAASAGIPMIAFTTDWKLAGNDTYVMGFLPFAQVSRVAQYAQSRGLSRFAVYAPQTEYCDVVIGTLQRGGAPVIRIGRYAAGETALQNLVQDFARQSGVTPADPEIPGSTPYGTPDFGTLMLPVGGESLRTLVSLFDLAGINNSNTRFIGTGLWDDESLSRNASSSRAIPVEKMIQSVIDDPAMPVAWGSNKPGMQAGEEVREKDVAQLAWKRASRQAVQEARNLIAIGLHKQIVNRLLAASGATVLRDCRVRAVAPDAIYIVGTPAELPFAVRQTRQMMPDMPIWGAYWTSWAAANSAWRSRWTPTM